MFLSSENTLEVTCIPEEIWLKVFSKLHITDYCNLRLTCKHFAYLSSAKCLRKNFQLRLINQESVQELKSHIEKYGAGTLPISTLLMKRLENSKELEYVLKELSSEIRSIQLTDSAVFQNMNDANLNNLEELYMHFDRLKAESIDLNLTWNIKNFRNLNTLHFILRPTFKSLNCKILQQLVEAGKSLQLKKISLTYFSTDDELIWKLLQIHADKMKYINIFYKSNMLQSSYLKWSELLSYMTQLETIKLSGGCSTDWAQNIFQNLSEKTPLKRIGFEFTKFNTDEILKFIIEKWNKTITSISLIACQLLTKNGINEIWKLRNNLKSLEIAYSSMSMDEIIDSVAKDVNYTLRKLNCTRLGEMLDNSVCKMAKNLPNLEELELSDLRTQLSNQRLCYVFQYLKGLRKFCFTTYSLCNLTGISNLQNLEELNLKYSYISSEVADDLVFPHLRILKLTCKRLKSYSFIKIAKNCPSLEILELENCNGLDDTAFYYICKYLVRLRKLNIKSCQNLTPEAINFAIYKSGIKLIEHKFDEDQGPDFDEFWFIT